MAVMVVDEQKKPLRGPYVVRLADWTLERYLKEAPEHQIWEFVRGEVVMYSPATAEHQDLVRFLLRLLDGYCEARGWGKVLTGPAAVQILPDVVREPDLFVLSPQEVLKAKGTPLNVRPTLVVEVVSPSTRTIDLVEKARDYAQAGIPEYWVVEPSRSVLHIHRLENGRYRVEPFKTGRVESQAVSGFWVESSWLFQEPLPGASKCLEELLKTKEPSGRD